MQFFLNKYWKIFFQIWDDLKKLTDEPRTMEIAKKKNWEKDVS